MPVIRNTRKERFAQEYAKGKSALAAMVDAGYKPDTGNAARLSRDPDVRARVEELQDRAGVRAEVSLAELTESLLRIAEKSEEIGEAPGYSVARAAIMDVAKLHGLVTDKTENKTIPADVSPDPLTPEEWQARFAPKQ